MARVSGACVIGILVVWQTYLTKPSYLDDDNLPGICFNPGVIIAVELARAQLHFFDLL